MNYAFIMNSGSLSPEDYSALYEDEGNHYYFAAVHGMKMTRELVKKLAGEGYQLIDLCGDFNEEKAKAAAEAADGKIKVSYAKYTKEELEKFEALTSTEKFGIIVLGFDLSQEAVRLELIGDEYSTYIAIVSDEETAGREAKRMVAEGIDFIELCGYFGADKAELVAKAMDHKVPLGYCGE